MHPALIVVVMGIEGGLVMEPCNHILDVWRQVRELINLEMNVIIGPVMHLFLELCPSRQETFLMVFHHVFTFMAVLVLPLWLLHLAKLHLAHPMLCCRQGDRLC